eukprot:1566138-Lingulodinium_polyedra.AAC.1
MNRQNHPSLHAELHIDIVVVNGWRSPRKYGICHAPCRALVGNETVHSSRTRWAPCWAPRNS